MSSMTSKTVSFIFCMPNPTTFSTMYAQKTQLINIYVGCISNRVQGTMSEQQCSSLTNQPQDTGNDSEGTTKGTNLAMPASEIQGSCSKYAWNQQQPPPKHKPSSFFPTILRMDLPKSKLPFSLKMGFPTNQYKSIAPDFLSQGLF